MYEYPDYLMHHGVKGMTWGVRKKTSNSMSSRKANRLAKKDAKEYARAKMYYGEGAGNRRKLIKATVNERSKNSTYKEAFDRNLANQDMAKHASKAKKERKANTTKAKVAKNARGLVNISTGSPQRAAASAMTLYNLYKIGKATGLNEKVASAVTSTVKNVYAHAKVGKAWVNMARNMR